MRPLSSQSATQLGGKVITLFVWIHYLPPVAVSRCFTACAHHRHSHKYPTAPALSLHLIHSFSAEVWIREKLDQHLISSEGPDPTRCSGSSSRHKHSRPAAGGFKPSYRPLPPPIVRSLDVKGIRSTAGLFLCSRGLGSGENIWDVSRKRPQH